MKINYYKPDSTNLNSYTIAWFKTLAETKAAKAILKKEGIPAVIIRSNSNLNGKGNLLTRAPIALNVSVSNRKKARIALKKLFPTKATGTTFLISKRQSLLFAVIGFFTFMLIGIMFSKIFLFNYIFFLLPFLGLIIGIFYGLHKFYYKCSAPNCGCFYNTKDSVKCKLCGKKIIGIIGSQNN